MDIGRSLFEKKRSEEVTFRGRPMAENRATLADLLFTTYCRQRAFHTERKSI
jgi:hypothetical protein